MDPANAGTEPSWTDIYKRNTFHYFFTVLSSLTLLAPGALLTLFSV